MPVQIKEHQGILVQLKEKAQLTLPQKIRESLGIQMGDYLEAIVKNNVIMLKPKMVMDRFPEATLSKKGQRMLKEALNDVKNGKVKKFSNIEDLIADLHN